jgi:hypothetical protein
MVTAVHTASVPHQPLITFNPNPVAEMTPGRTWLLAAFVAITKKATELWLKWDGFWKLTLGCRLGIFGPLEALKDLNLSGINILPLLAQLRK